MYLERNMAVFQDKFQGPKKIIGTLGKGVKVRTTIKITIIAFLGLELGVWIDMVIKEKRKNKSIRVTFTFNLGTMMWVIDI